MMRLVGVPNQETAVHLPVQRLWLLERGAPGDAEHRRGGTYAGAVILLGRQFVYGLIIISSDAERASEVSAFARRDDGDPGLMRDAFAFVNLAEALDGLDTLKQQFLARGWVELPTD